MAALELWDRDWLVRVNGIEFTGLDVKFDITKSLKPEPNTCSLQIFGLKAEHRRAVEQLNLYDPEGGTSHKRGPKFTPTQAGKPATSTTAKGPKPGRIRVDIEAGYKDFRSLIFSGDLRQGITSYTGTDVVLKLTGEDGGRTFQATRLTRNYPAGTRQLDVIRDCAAEMGLGLGNILEVTPYLSGSYPQGKLVDGQASKILTEVLRVARVSYSVQNGVLAFRRAGMGLASRGLYLDKDTGLVGSPQRTTTGAVLFTCLLVPLVAPGQYVQLKSRDFEGVYYIRKVTTTGDTQGNDWYHECEAYPG